MRCVRGCSRSSRVPGREERERGEGVLGGWFGVGKRVERGG